MPLTVEVTAVDAAQSTESYDLIAVPVWATDEGIVPLAQVRPAAVGLGAPPVLDPGYAARHHFEATPGQSLVLASGPGSPTILAIGMGAAPTTEQWRQVGAAAVRATNGRRALVVVDPAAPASEAVATGALLASYRFALRSTPEPARVEGIELLGAAATAVAAGTAIAGAVGQARDLVNQVPSELTPTNLAAAALDALAGVEGIVAEVWDEDRIAAERLGGLLGVAKGSHEPPRLVKATYTPAGTSRGHVVLVGKGITFDSGGLSLKTATGMTTMKTDMTGAAVVLSLLAALPALDVDVTVTAIAPMAENMPGGAAMKPGDVLNARSGTTIEVLNTDAEGRLILADGLVLAVEEAPDLIIDVATLTGAAIIALGKGVGALLSNSDEAAAAFATASDESGERLWRLPLVEEYESHIASEVADIKNVGATGEAGTISAGLFLQRFVGATPWVHLDIAGPGRSEKDAGYLAKGGTAFSLRTILEYLRSR